MALIDAVKKKNRAEKDGLDVLIFDFWQLLSWSPCGQSQTDRKSQNGLLLFTPWQSRTNSE